MILVAIFSFSAFDLPAQVKTVQEDAYAELSRKERRKWKKIARQYKRNPEGLKVLSEEHAELKDANAQLKSQIQQLEQRLANTGTNQDQYQSRINTLESERDQLAYQLEAARESIRELNEKVKDLPAGMEDARTGVIYRVQIGAFEEREIAEDLNTSDMLKLDREGDLQKVVIGLFRDYDRASRLRTQLREMGVRDAWIVTYRDGRRINIEKASNRK